MIACARFSPIPLTETSSSFVAVLMFTAAKAMPTAASQIANASTSFFIGSLLCFSAGFAAYRLDESSPAELQNQTVRPSERRNACRWPAMVSCLLVSVGELDHIAVIVRPAEKGDSRRQIIPGESGGNDDRRDEDQKCIQVRRAFLIDEGRIDSVFDQCGLMLHCFVDDCVELMIRHGF